MMKDEAMMSDIWWKCDVAGGACMHVQIKDNSLGKWLKSKLHLHECPLWFRFFKTVEEARDTSNDDSYFVLYPNECARPVMLSLDNSGFQYISFRSLRKSRFFKKFLKEHENDYFFTDRDVMQIFLEFLSERNSGSMFFNLSCLEIDTLTDNTNTWDSLQIEIDLAC